MKDIGAVTFHDLVADLWLTHQQRYSRRLAIRLEPKYRAVGLVQRLEHVDGGVGHPYQGNSSRWIRSSLSTLPACTATRARGAHAEASWAHHPGRSDVPGDPPGVRK